MAILHSHYTKLLKLDGADADDEQSAAAVLGIKPGFPARKALDQYRKLGGSGVARAIGLLAQADLDLRGAKDWPEALVMEVLVARLVEAGAGPPLKRDEPGPSPGSCVIEARTVRQAQPAALIFFIRRLLRRAAWFLWMTPLAAAMSRRFTARRSDLGGSSVPTALTAFLRGSSARS